MRMSWTWGLPLEGTSSSFFQTVGSSLLYNNRKARQAQWSLNPSAHKSAAAGMTLLYQSNLSLYKLPLKSWMWTLKTGIQGRTDAQICFTSPLQLNLVIKRLLTWLCSASLVNSGLVLTQKEKRHGLSCTRSGWFHKTHTFTRASRHGVLGHHKMGKRNQWHHLLLYECTRAFLQAHHSRSRTNTGTENDRKADGFLFYH